MHGELPVIDSLDELIEAVEHGRASFVRWSAGPAHDRREKSRDHAAGLELPGLAVNPLRPPSWWTLPLDQWVARQVRAYEQLGEERPGQYAWVLRGRVVERGPDNEPLVVDVEPVARLSGKALSQASERAPRSPRPEDQGADWQS